MDKLISEKAVLKILDDYYRAWFLNDERFMDAVNAIKAIPSAEPCEDAISRQAVLELVADYDLSMGQVVKGIHDLPPVTPQQKMGHWYSDCRDDYFICNQCKAEFERFSQGGYELIDDYNYCPNCGARMD